MILYTKDGKEVNTDKDQVEILLKTGEYSKEKPDSAEGKSSGSAADEFKLLTTTEFKALSAEEKKDYLAKKEAAEKASNGE